MLHPHALLVLLVLGALAACQQSDLREARHILALEHTMPAPSELPAELPMALPAEGLQSELVDAPRDRRGQLGLWPNAMLDRDGTLLVAYCDGDKGDAKLARRAKSGWQVETVDSKGAVGKYMSAVLGKDGPELLYLDQDRFVLRYAHRVRGAWQIDDVARGPGELGIAGRFLLGPNGERVLLHFNHRFELLLTRGTPSPQEQPLVWATHTLLVSAGTYQSHIGAYYDDQGVLHVSFPDQTIGAPGIHTGSIAPGATTLALHAAESLLAPETDLARLPGKNELYKLTRRHEGEDTLEVATLGDGDAIGPSSALAKDVRAFRALSLSDGFPALAMTTGKVAPGCDGVARHPYVPCPPSGGGGRLELAWRSDAGWRRVTIDARAVGDFSAVERRTARGSIVELLYYDEEAHGLRHASLPLFQRREGEKL